MRTLVQKKSSKDEREGNVLLGLVDLYIETGAPIGSNTLRENGFEHLSSATIRNYFAKLEAQGFLKQQHSSGGRIPTPLAFQKYAEAHEKVELGEKEKRDLKKILTNEGREIASYLLKAAETLSEMSSCAIILSAPRFDQDFVLDVKLVSVDPHRVVCILLTDFGIIRTETLYLEEKLSHSSLERIQDFFRFKIAGHTEPKLSKKERFLAEKWYKEILLRHIANYTHFTADDHYKTGFSNLLNYSDFNNAATLSQSLALFEDRKMLQECMAKAMKSGEIEYFIGEAKPNCTLICAPYKINQTTVGAIALLGPCTLPYKKLFALLREASTILSDTITSSVYKFKLSYRMPNVCDPALEESQCLLLEDKGKNHE